MMNKKKVEVVVTCLKVILYGRNEETSKKPQSGEPVAEESNSEHPERTKV
jgi:hypothetical protein